MRCTALSVGARHMYRLKFMLWVSQRLTKSDRVGEVLVEGRSTNALKHGEVAVEVI